MGRLLKLLLLWTICWIVTLPNTVIYASSVDDRLIKGNVTDESGEPIIGASVLEVGTNNGTITDIDGNFFLTLQGTENTLEISYMGYKAQKITVKVGEILRIILREDSEMLDEVVVVGYQTIRKTDLVGAVASIKADELNVTTPTVGQALVGKVAGVQISQVSGAPYNSTKIRIRGVASINASSDPLYVIDGYPSNEDLMLNPEDIESIEVLKDAASAAIYGSRAAGGVILITTKRGKEGKPKVNYNFQYSINQLAKKVKLLNSAQWADLFVDGHNNAYKDLLVNAGKDWDDSYYSDTNDVRTERLGSYNSAAMIPDFLYDFDTQTVITPEYDTDWQDELYRNAPAQRHHVSINGGTDMIRYEVSVAYQDQDGIIISTSQKRLNLRANVDMKVNERLKVGVNFSNTSNWNREVQEGRFNQGPILGALIYAPIFRCYDDDGNLIKGEMASYNSEYGLQQVENPVALATETIIRRDGTRNTYNLTGQFELLKDLFINANLGMYTYDEKYKFYRPTSLSTGSYQPYSDQAKAAAYSIAQTTQKRDFLGEFTANYNKTWQHVHNFNGVAGYSIQKDTEDILGVEATGYEDDHITEVTGHGADASDIELYNTSKSSWTMLSYFTRLNYNYDNRYYLTVSFRGDASSRFGPDNRWGYFPSVSVAWTMSNEDFYKNAFGDNSSLKWRASWGMSGNNDIGDYEYTAEMNSVSGVVFGTGTISDAIYPDGVKDSSIGWEKTSQYNIGFDLSLFTNRLAISANYYLSYTKDLLFEQTISAISGTTSFMTNLPNSKIRNTGCDIQIDGRVISTKDFNLNIGGNISVNRNKVLELDEGSTIITNGAERSYMTHITTEGQPIGMFYGYKVAGIVTEEDMEGIAADDAVYEANGNSFPEGYVLQGPARSLSSDTALQPGDLYFEDVNGDGVVDEDDKTIIGNPHPKFTYGLNINGNYKNIDFTASFNGSYGNQVLDGQDYYLFNMEGSGNQYVEADERYRSADDPGNGWVYRASRGSTQSNSTRLSTFYLQDGSFFRCTNITLGYTFEHIHQIFKGMISSARFYVAADNLFTITKYKGYNPEVDYNDGDNLTPGVDYGKYPLARTYSLGIQVSF